MGSGDEEDNDEDDDDDSDEDEYTHPSNVLIEEIMDGQIGDAQITAMSAAKVSHAHRGFKDRHGCILCVKCNRFLFE